LTSSNHYEEVAMNRYHPIRRAAGILAGLAGALLALAAGSPAALAIRLPPPGGYDRPVQPPPQVHTIVTGGMPGWQITLIAAAAAVIAATVAVIADRAWAARRHLPARTA
jgi:hypothetical protein